MTNEQIKAAAASLAATAQVAASTTAAGSSSSRTLGRIRLTSKTKVTLWDSYPDEWKPASTLCRDREPRRVEGLRMHVPDRKRKRPSTIAGQCYSESKPKPAAHQYDFGFLVQELIRTHGK